MIDRQVDVLNKQIVDTCDLIMELHALSSTFQSIRIIEHGYLLTGTNDYLDELEIRDEKCNSILATLERLVKDDPEQYRLLREIRDTYNTTLNQYIKPLFEYRAAFKDNPSLILEDDGIIEDMLARSDSASLSLHTLIEAIQKNVKSNLGKTYSDFAVWQHKNWVGIFHIPIIGIPLLLVGSILLLAEMRRHSSDHKRNLELLRNERDCFEAALRSANLITYTWDLENDIIAAEDRMYRNKLKENVTYKRQMIISILNQLYEKEESIEEHSKRVSAYAANLAEQTHLSTEEVELIEKAALFHDLGKIAVNPKILSLRNTQLTPSQNVEFKRHPEIGYNILRSLDEYTPLAEAVLYHHERFDGNGYPRGLKGEEIPFYAQIIAVANAWVNLTSSPPGTTQEQVPKSVAVASLEAMKETVLDPNLVDCFLNQVIADR